MDAGRQRTGEDRHRDSLLRPHAGAVVQAWFFDLTVKAKGDIDIDEHHTVEDVGIVMGKALHQALGEKAGIKRFGFASAPLDETLAQVTVDLSGRPYLVYNVALPDRKIKAST